MMISEVSISGMLYILSVTCSLRRGGIAEFGLKECVTSFPGWLFPNRKGVPQRICGLVIEKFRSFAW